MCRRNSFHASLGLIKSAGDYLQIPVLHTIIKPFTKGASLVTRNITSAFGSGSDEQNSRQQLQSGVPLVNRYHIQDVIGVGGMGSVYCARNLHFQNYVKLVAVKEKINQTPDPAVRKTVVQDFEREEILLAPLNYPSTPRSYDYFTRNDHSSLVLEFIHEKDPEAFMADSILFLPEDQVIDWAIQLCAVLVYLHGHKPAPVTIRDMKPSRIMINNNRDVILVDFGFARTFQAGKNGTMIGTEGCFPPEQYLGEATQIEEMYSPGAAVHHVMTRRGPLLETPCSFMERPIRLIKSNVSPEFEAVINTTLQYNPCDRLEGAEMMKDALLTVIQKTGIPTNMTSSIASSTGGIKPLWSYKWEDEVRGTPLKKQGMQHIGSYDNTLYTLTVADGGMVSLPMAYDDNLFFCSEDHLLHCISLQIGKLNGTYFFIEGRTYSSPRRSDGYLFFGLEDQSLHAVNATSGRSIWKFLTVGPIYSSPLLENEMIYFGTETDLFYALDYRGELKGVLSGKTTEHVLAN